MKALASIRKIIIATKTNCRRRKSDNDDAASVGLRRSSPSSGQIEQVNVNYSEKSTTVDGITVLHILRRMKPLLLNAYRQLKSMIPPRCLQHLIIMTL